MLRPDGHYTPGTEQKEQSIALETTAMLLRYHKDHKYEQLRGKKNNTNWPHSCNYEEFVTTCHTW